MAWSKVFTTTNSFTFNSSNTNVEDLNFKSNDGTAVLEEYFTFIATRGWVVEEVYNDTDGRAWKCRKDFICTDGGTQTIGFWFRYDITTAPNYFYCWSWDPASDEITGSNSYKMFNVSLTSTTSDATVCAGKWSFWTSDEDNDSFLIMAEETAGDTVIGFWPASGTLLRQGFGNTTVAYLKSGFKILYPGLNMYPTWEADASSTSGELEHLLVDPSYRTGLPAELKKFDYAWLANGYGRPLMRQFGGDVQMMASLGNDPSAQFINRSNTAQPTAVYEISNRYYIGLQYNGPVLLFDCGETAPVF